MYFFSNAFFKNTTNNVFYRYGHMNQGPLQYMYVLEFTRWSGDYQVAKGLWST